MLWKGKLLDEQVRIALINGGSIRSSIPKGTITMGDIRTVLPFENKMVIIELTGAEIIETLEKVLNIIRIPVVVLQVAGLKFRFNPMKPAGNRVLSVSVMD